MRCAGGRVRRPPRSVLPQAVAGAALAVAALMNAPPGFLEFLLCVPWAALGTMYPFGAQAAGGSGGGAAAPPLNPAAFFDWSAAGAGLGLEAGRGAAPASPTGAAAEAAAGAAEQAPAPAAAAAAGKPAGWAPQLEASAEERAAIVNLPLAPELMGCVLDFLLREAHAESLPPMLRAPHGDPLTETQQARGCYPPGWLWAAAGERAGPRLWVHCALGRLN